MERCTLGDRPDELLGLVQLVGLPRIKILRLSELQLRDLFTILDRKDWECERNET